LRIFILIEDFYFWILESEFFGQLSLTYRALESHMSGLCAKTFVRQTPKMDAKRQKWTPNAKPMAHSPATCLFTFKSQVHLSLGFGFTRQYIRVPRFL